MRRFTSPLIAALAAIAFLPLGARAADVPNVPLNVTIPTTLSATVTSQTAHRGDPFTFVTTKDENLGGVDVPKGTPGVGRIADVTKARKGHNGSVSLQADMLQLSGGRTVWVNIAPSALRGHYANRHIFPYILPIPPLIFPGAVFTRTGDLILDKGTAFAVVTITPRHQLAPLVGGAAPAAPITPSPSASADGSSPAP